jgi:hypothetical protein
MLKKFDHCKPNATEEPFIEYALSRKKFVTTAQLQYHLLIKRQQPSPSTQHAA